MSKRLICLTLCLALLAALCPAASAQDLPRYADAAYDPDYTAWSQRDPAWKDLTLGAQCDMESAGCLLTTMAILMCAAGVYNARSFNPGVLRDYLESAGLVSHDSLSRTGDGNVSLTALEQGALPRFVYQGIRYASGFSGLCALAQDYIAQGLSVAAMVRSGRHYVAVLQAGTDDCAIADPYYGYTALSQWAGSIVGLLVFRPDAQAADVIGCLWDDSILAYRATAQSSFGVYQLTADAQLYYSPGPGGESGKTALAGTVYECAQAGTGGDGQLWRQLRGGDDAALYLPASALTALDAGWGGYACPTGTLSLGDSGDGVWWLQLGLRALGLLEAADGGFGEKTRAAVEAFQTLSGLEADGVAGTRTRLALVRRLAGSPALDVYTAASDTQPLTAAAQTDGSGFPDLDPDAWYYGAAAALQAAGVLEGAALGAGGALEPLAAERRDNLAQYLCNLWRAWGGSVYAYTVSPFSDVAVSHPRFAAIAWAQGCGIVEGGSDGAFDPESALTRAQLCAVLLRFFDHAGAPLPAGTPDFTDWDEIPVWAQSAVAACRAAGLVEGLPDGSFDPSGTVTRAQVCAVLARVQALLGP